MYQMSDSTKACVKQILDHPNVLAEAPEIILCLARSLYAQREEDGMSELWAKLHKSVGKDVKLFSMLCGAI